jgi:hypothetical protein
MHFQRSLFALVAAMLLATHMSLVSGQGLPVQYGLLGLGDLTTSDQAGPYNVPLVQAHEVEGEWLICCWISSAVNYAVG